MKVVDYSNFHTWYLYTEEERPCSNPYPWWFASLEEKLENILPSSGVKGKLVVAMLPPGELITKYWKDCTICYSKY